MTNRASTISKLSRLLSLSLNPRRTSSDYIALHTYLKNNNKKLPESIKNAAYEYAHDVLRGDKDYYALCYYAMQHGEFKEGWITESFYLRNVMPSLNNHIGSLTDQKSLTRRILGLRETADLCYVINGELFDTDFIRISPQATIELCRAHGDQVFHKCDGSMNGKGVSRLDTASLTADALSALPNGCLQRPIRQHAFFDRMTRNSLGTIRVLTLRNGRGDIEVRGHFLRVGLDAELWVAAKGGVRIGILNSDGDLAFKGRLSDQTEVTAHPDSGFRFEGARIPHFGEALEFCKSLHERSPHMRFVGWDVAINEQGEPELIEWNGTPGIGLVEGTIGPCFRDLHWERYR